MRLGVGIPGSANGAKADSPARLAGEAPFDRLRALSKRSASKRPVARKERGESNALGIRRKSASPEGASVIPKTKSARQAPKWRLMNNRKRQAERLLTLTNQLRFRMTLSLSKRVPAGLKARPHKAQGFSPVWPPSRPRPERPPANSRPGKSVAISPLHIVPE